MGLGSRFGLVLANLAMLIPVYILLVATAIMSSIAAADMAKLVDQNDSLKSAYGWVTSSTIALWGLFAGSILFSLTIGLFIIPYIITIPYLYGPIMILFALLNLSIAGIMFYAAYTVGKTSDFKNSTKPAVDAFNNALISGILMVVASIFMVIYATYTMHKYRKGGGLSGDVALGAQVMSVAAPELAPVATVVGQYAQGNLSDAQKQELAARGQGVNAVAQAATAAGGKSLTELIRENPQLVGQVLESL